MSYHLNFSKQALSDIEFHKRSGKKAILKKLLVLLNEIAEDPFDGTGKPEALKFALKGCWSRRITGEHRLVYEVVDDTVHIHSALGHYE
jgi:toxin YoeB